MKIRVISDAVCNHFLGNIPSINEKEFDVSFAPVDQFIPEILNSNNNDFLIVHLTQYAFNSYSISNSYLAALQEILESLQDLISKSKCKIIINSIYFNDESFTQDESIENKELIFQTNNLILKFAKKNPLNVILVDVANLISDLGSYENLNFRNYSVMRSPYSKKLAEVIKEEYIFHLHNYHNPRKKVVFVDADNTLWDGVVGEEGIHGIKVDHEFPGSIFYSFQKNLLKLKNSGIILCLVTKNNYEDIQEVFKKKDMPLTLDDFVEIKANWEPKSKNIKDLLKTLNVGSSSTIFIDDNPFEIEEVKRLNNEILCIRFDKNNFYKLIKKIHKTFGLYAHNLTNEDKAKSQSYIEEKHRKENKNNSSSIEEYLLSLSMKMKIFYNQKDHIPRISQLTQKTNQFNLTTKRYSLIDIENLMENDSVYSFSVEDKFGDMGIIGVLIIKSNLIDTLLLSCRAFGRNIEKTMLSEALEHNNIFPVYGNYIPSKKNAMTKNFYTDNGFIEHDDIGNKKTFIIKKNVQYPQNHFKEILWK